jgi:predicted lipoprotein with Yx(FWY)xxD motif
MNASSRIAALSAVPLVIAALALSACGSNGDTTSPTTVAKGGETVMSASLEGVGTVLVDANGDAVYSSSQEANGTIQCTGSCAQTWKPVSATGGPTGSADVTGELGTAKRPDGTEQVTLDGTPLYTFAEDPPGQVTGDGLQDSFDGKNFTWHVITVGAAEQQEQSSTAGSASGYGY